MLVVRGKEKGAAGVLDGEAEDSVLAEGRQQPSFASDQEPEVARVLAERMPNGDPPSAMLWGMDE